jgi:hypothetical protein
VVVLSCLVTEKTAGRVAAALAALGGVVTLVVVSQSFFLSRSPPTFPPGFATIDRALRQLTLANVAFSAPTKLEKDETANVRLLLSFRKPLDALQAELTEVGQKEGARVRVSPLMEARLTGSGFEIEAIRPEVQGVSTEANTEWRWEIAGARPGRRQLHLTLSALITVDGEQTPRAIRTFDRTIDVDVTFGQRVNGLIHDHWEFFVATILIPLSLWLGHYWWRHRRKKREEEYGW